MLALLRVTDKCNGPEVWKPTLFIFFEINLSHFRKIMPRVVQTARYKFHEMNLWNRLIQKHGISILLSDNR